MSEHVSEKRLAEIAHLLKELIVWTKVQSAPRVKELLQQMSSQERVAYELSDGTKTQVEIAKQIGVTQATISNWWKKWAVLGLTSESEIYSGRQKQNFPLSDFGISRPATGSKKDNQETPTQETKDG